MLISKKRWRLFLLYTLLFLFIILLYRIRIQLKYIFEPFIIAIILTYLFNPMVNYIEKMLIKMNKFKKRSPRLYAVIILYFSLGSIILFLGWYTIPALISESKKLISDVPNYIQDVQERIVLFRESSLNQLPEGINRIIDVNIERMEVTIVKFLENVSILAVDFFSRILNLIMIPVLTFYFLKDKNHFIRILKFSIPRRWKPGIIEIAKKSDKVIGNFIRGRILVAIFIGIFISIGLKILGINFAVIIGLMAGILDIIPYFGPVIGAVPAVVLAFLQNPVRVIWVILLFLVVQQVEGDIIAPKIIGENIGLHPVTIILALLIGGTFFGIMGMIFAIPVMAILKVVVEHIVNYIATDDNY